MHVFESVIVILLGAVALTALARRVGVPYPTFLALGGAALSLLPGAPVLALDPHLALALFVAPVLLDSAYDTSLRDLNDNRLTIVCLVLVAVGLTTAAVAVVAHWLVPGMPGAAAVALGAIVAPPDAAAATTVLRQVDLPRRLLTILEGESLLNDASALLIYRIAVGTVVGGAFSWGGLASNLMLSLPCSLVVGYLCARLVLLSLLRVRDVPGAIVLQFVLTFLVWILAERIGLSGILTIVSYAITLARRAPAITPARIRVPAYAVWDTVIFLLNVLAFATIGLQIGPLRERLPPAVRTDYLVVALAVLATVIGVRVLWCMSYNAALRRHIARHGFHPPRPMMRPSVQSGLVISWCGMRGIVTLAAAFALPESFPFRDLILVVAFGVVLGTLVLQGMSLRPMLRRMHFDDGAPLAREVALARGAAYRAAHATLDGDASPEAEALRHEYAAADRPAAPGQAASEPPQMARRAVDELWRRGDIGDDAFHRLEEEFDRLELCAGAQDGD